MHEDGRSEVHPGQPLGLRGGYEAVLDRPHVQAGQLFLGLLLRQRVARNLRSAQGKGGVGWRKVFSCFRCFLVGQNTPNGVPSAVLNGLSVASNLVGLYGDTHTTPSILSGPPYLCWVGLEAPGDEDGKPRRG